jgi:8-oxo-dGTP pyrophosphatase MutT (NUDIX family)
MSEPAPAHPSATVVLLRDAEEAFEVLLLRRSRRLTFHGGDWVFPGGRVDPADAAGCALGSLEAARRAAVRETAEEAGLAIDEGELVPIAHWITPVHFPKRFSTWFFAARVQAAPAVVVDRGEITAHRFFTPRAALEAQARGEIGLPPPTYVTLVELAAAPSPSAFLEAARRATPRSHLPRYRTVEGGECSLLPGDVAYEGLPLDAEGPRHRLFLVGGAYRLERTPR